MADPRTFSLFDENEAVTLPTDSIEIIRNRNALRQYVLLNEKINKSVEIDPKDEENLKTLQAELEESKLKISMRGLAPDAIENIRENVRITQFPDVDAKAEDVPDELAEAMTAAVLHAMITSIERPDGAVAEAMDAATLQKWYNSLPVECQGDISKLSMSLSFSAWEYNTEVTSPDF